MACGIRILVLLLLLPLPACSHPQETQGNEMMLNLPYEPAARDCYAQLKKCNKAYRDGFEEMRNQADSSIAFADRLRRVYATFESAAAGGRAQPSSYTWSEEDVFQCCVFDLTKAMFDSETKAILDGKQGREKKREQLLDLVKLLEALPSDGPKWNQIVMPKIKIKLEEAANKLQ